MPLLTVAALTNNQNAVRVITIPTPGGRGLMVITTPCSANKSGSVALWTARQSLRGVQVIPLYSWMERRALLGSGMVNRLLLRITTFQRC